MRAYTKDATAGHFNKDDNVIITLSTMTLYLIVGHLAALLTVFDVCNCLCVLSFICVAVFKGHAA